LQIGFYIAFIIFLIAVLIFGKGYYYYDYYDYPIGDCSSTIPTANSSITPTDSTITDTTPTVPPSASITPTESSVTTPKQFKYQDDVKSATTQGADGCYYYVLDTGKAFLFKNESQNKHILLYMICSLCG
jgi:hypothetical protein